MGVQRSGACETTVPDHVSPVASGGFRLLGYQCGCVSRGLLGLVTFLPYSRSVQTLNFLVPPLGRRALTLFKEPVLHQQTVERNGAHADAELFE